MTDLELISFKIIASVGAAKSDYLSAIKMAKQGNYMAAKEMIKSGEQHFLCGHEAHYQLIGSEANGESINFSLLLMHAEDQMSSAEMCKILAEELIALYECGNIVVRGA